jgi:hypothetical protein
MTQDKSREKSLLFLLSAVSRSLEVSPDNRIKIRESIATLQIQDAGDNWIISTEAPSGDRKNVEIGKGRFIFYPVKSAARYEMNPAILNKNSAQEVLLKLFADLGAQIPGKTLQTTQRKISDFIPTNLAWIASFSITSTYMLTPISMALILAHLFMSTSKQFTSSVRRSILISSVGIPTILFLMLSDSLKSNISATLFSVILLFAFDFLIRLESSRRSRTLIVFTQIVSLIILGFIVVLNTENRLLLLIFVSIVVVGYLLQLKYTSSSFRNFSVLVLIGLFISYMVLATIANPLRILLVPYVAYIALHETLFGENRNPSKIAFGLVCLTI